MINFDYTTLQKRCLTPTHKFWTDDSIVTVDGNYHFIDNDAPILAVVHLDSVETRKHFYRMVIDGETWVFNPQLDDRIGAYVILDILPKLGVKMDILLTENEEKGKTTCKHFPKTKQYNWMFSFDRQGEDLVYYRFYDADFVKCWTDAGFKNPNKGISSDINYLGHLGCRGMNIGTGLVDGHNIWARNSMDVLSRQIERFMTFYINHRDTYFEYAEYVKPASTAQTYTHGIRYIQCKGDGCKREVSEYYAKSTNGLCYECHTTKRICIKCKRSIAGTNMLVWDDLCEKCEKKYSHCGVLSCRKMVKKSELMEGLCESCVERAQSDGGVGRKTDLKCPYCTFDMTDTEIVRYGMCAVCFSKRDYAYA